MPGNARQVAALGPSPITVHDDGYVMWKPFRIEAGENLGLFAVQPGGNSRAQSKTSRNLLKITQDSASCNQELRLAAALRRGLLADVIGYNPARPVSRETASDVLRF